MQTQLSTSQRQLIRLFALGYTDGEIARKMALSPDQLQGTFADVCSQFKVADRIELLLMMWSSRRHLRYVRSSPTARDVLVPNGETPIPK
jgi:DNA-binding NarL/FixJ family response regulator